MVEFRGFLFGMAASIYSNRQWFFFFPSSHPANMRKNRYSDVQCVEHSRVRLSLIKDDEVSGKGKRARF